MLDTPLAGLMGVDMEGRIVWRNASASRLLGMLPDGEQPEFSKVDEILQSSFSELASNRDANCSLLRLPNGLQVHVHCELRARDGRQQLFAIGKPVQEVVLEGMRPQISPPSACVADDDAALPVISPAEPASLRDADVDLIARTLKECGGNVSAAARKLQVSRGLIYRRIQGA
jgi:hypothetical protein